MEHDTVRVLVGQFWAKLVQLQELTQRKTVLRVFALNEGLEVRLQIFCPFFVVCRRVEKESVRQLG